MLRKTVLDPYSGVWKSSVVVGRESDNGNKRKRNADAFETPTLLDGKVRQRGMTVPGHEDICKPGRPVCNLSAMELSASVLGVGAA